MSLSDEIEAAAAAANEQEQANAQGPVAALTSLFDLISPETLALGVQEIEARYRVQLALMTMQNQAFYDAFHSGQMTADQVQQYMQDLRSGARTLPPGAMLKAGVGLAIPAALRVQ